MLSGEQENKYDTDDTSNNKVTPSSHDTSNYNDNPGMGEKYKLKMAPQLIISAVTSKTQDVNLTNSWSKISTSGFHWYKWS